jgi:broad specificity phosphatase PhoE
MKIFGYGRKKVNEQGLLEMDEVCFQASPRALRAIAKLLTESADLIENNPGSIEHLHLQDTWQEWQEGYPDIIVAE